MPKRISIAEPSHVRNLQARIDDLECALEVCRKARDEAVDLAEMYLFLRDHRAVEWSEMANEKYRDQVLFNMGTPVLVFTVFNSGGDAASDAQAVADKDIAVREAMDKARLAAEAQRA